MATISKKELVDRVANRIDGPNKTAVHDIVQKFLDEIVAAVVAGDRLEFRDFGVFTPKTRAARTARNPKTGEAVAVPPQTIVTFKLGKEFKLKLNATAPTTAK